MKNPEDRGVGVVIMKTKTTMFALLLASLSATGCVAVRDDGYYQDPPPPPPPAPYQASWHPTSMYAVSAAASSDGMPGSSDYSSMQATGAPDVNACVDDPRAWTPSNADPVPGTSSAGVTVDDWLELTFPEPISVHQVRIYETYAPGAIVAVGLESSFGGADPLVLWNDYSGDGPAPCPSAFAITLDGYTASDAYDRVVVYLDSNLVGDANGNGIWGDDFNAIDAVELSGDAWY